MALRGDVRGKLVRHDGMLARLTRPAIKLAAMVGGMKRSSGSRWYVSVLTALAAVAMIWIISEAAGSRAKPPVLVTTEH